MLTGQAAIPWSVSGVTTAPSRMPTRTKHTRASGIGTRTGRPANAATATKSMDPDTSPPGKPSIWKPMPPAAAISSVSTTCRIWRAWRGGGGIAARPMPWSATSRQMTAWPASFVAGSRAGKSSGLDAPPFGAAPDRSSARIFSPACPCDRLGDRFHGHKGGPIDAARLGRYRLRARLYRPVVRDRELRRPNPALRPGRPLASLHLSVIARDLLHVVDLFRIGWPCVAHRIRFPDHLHWSDAGDRALLAADHAHRAARQGAEHHFDRRLHCRPLRQGPDGCRDRGADRYHRHDPIHRAAAQSGVLVLDDHSRAYRTGQQRDAAGAGRHRALRSAGNGDLRGIVRN